MGFCKLVLIFKFNKKYQDGEVLYDMYRTGGQFALLIIPKT
jgi:hypothetical protein